MFRAAVVGCGRIGSRLADDPLLGGDVFTHAEAYVRCPATSLVALCDSDASCLRRAGERWDVTSLHSDAVAMMQSESPEIVSVCTPTGTHAGIVRSLISGDTRPRMILCEKPLAATLADAKNMAALAEQAGVILATVYMRRYAANIRALRDLIESGELGSIQAVSGWYIGGTAHNGTHWFDLLRMLCGEVAWVQAFDALRESGPDPTLDIILGLESGPLATLRACDATRFTLFELDLVASSGRARMSDSGHVVELWKAAPSPRYTGYVELAALARDLGGRSDLMLRAVEDAVHALESGAAPACTADDGVRAMRIADAALRSNGRRIDL